MVSDSRFIDRLIERLDRLDPSCVQGYVLRLVREKGVLETILQTVREGILIVGRDLHIHFVNNAAIHMLGLPEDVRERENQQINRYLRELDWTRLLAQDPQEWERASRQEIEVFYPNHRHLRFYLLPYPHAFPRSGPDRDDDAGMVTIILQDVTEERRETDSTIQTEKHHAITMLAAGVAHEIGNPLNSLTIHLQLLQRHFRSQNQDPGAEDGLRLVEVSLQEIRRLNNIITQFLSAIRPRQLDLVPIGLKEPVTSTLETLKHEIADRGIFVETQWPERVPAVMGDETQLKQVFYNIILNAIQAMTDGGLLTIDLEEHDDAVVLRFRDTGKGIAAEDLAKVFTPYYTTRAEGTGLGLMVVERILREHGAELGVDSEPGRGTVFTIRFPRREQRLRLLEYRASDETSD